MDLAERELILHPTIEYNKALCEKYPFLTWTHDPLFICDNPDKEPDYKYTWQDEIPDGWRLAFCPTMWDELKAILEKANYTNEFEFMQIKEKYGTLRLYYGGVPESIYKEVSAWEDKYDRLSEQTCMRCGAKAEVMTLGWISYYCKNCMDEMYKKDYCHARSIPITDIEEYYKDKNIYWINHPQN